jgi:hypothetical protein
MSDNRRHEILRSQAAGTGQQLARPRRMPPRDPLDKLREEVARLHLAVVEMTAELKRMREAVRLVLGTVAP